MKAMTHSKTAATLLLWVKVVETKTMARTSSTRMKASLIQKEERRMRYCRFSTNLLAQATRMCIYTHIYIYIKGERREKRRTDAQALILPADKDGREPVATDKQKQKDVVQLLVAPGVEDGQQDEAGGADEGEQDAQPDEGALAGRLVAHEAAAVAQPALGEEGQVEEDDGDGGAGDEERLELLRTNVADVGDGAAALHGRVDAAVCVDDPVEEHAEEHA